MSLPYMRLYVADYIADTQDFTCEEHGAYLLLIMYYWRNGGLPADEERLARIVKLDAMRWQSVRFAVARRFSDNWRHKRIDAELQKADDKSLKATLASAKSWEARGKIALASARRSHKQTQSVRKASQPSYKESLYDLTEVGKKPPKKSLSEPIGEISEALKRRLGIAPAEPHPAIEKLTEGSST